MSGDVISLTELAPRGQIPITPKLPPLPKFMAHIPFGLNEQGQHIRDIRGNVVKPVIVEMLNCVERRNPGDPQGARMKAQEELVSRLNACIANSMYHISSDYLMREGNLYSYEFNAYLHHVCNEMAEDPHYFFNIGLGIIGESVRFFFNAGSLRQVYMIMARIGSKFSAEQFATLEDRENSIIIQRRTPVTREQLGDTAWFVHVISGCQTLRGALSTFPRIHSNLPHAEIDEHKCLLHGDECCEWKFTWQGNEKASLFGWLGRKKE